MYSTIKWTKRRRRDSGKNIPMEDTRMKDVVAKITDSSSYYCIATASAATFIIICLVLLYARPPLVKDPQTDRISTKKLLSLLCDMCPCGRWCVYLFQAMKNPPFFLLYIKMNYAEFVQTHFGDTQLEGGMNIKKILLGLFGVAGVARASNLVTENNMMGVVVPQDQESHVAAKKFITSSDWLSTDYLTLAQQGDGSSSYTVQLQDTVTDAENISECNKDCRYGIL